MSSDASQITPKFSENTSLSPRMYFTFISQIIVAVPELKYSSILKLPHLASKYYIMQSLIS